MHDCNVLVVEDDSDTREAVVELLKSEGYPAAGASDGQAALDLLARGEFEPDVIMLDLQMPSMDGKQFRAELQASPRWAKVPVILCSGTMPVAGAGRDIFDQLAKPFDVDSLLAVVQRGCALKKKSPAQVLSA
jgi:CheY-like chemotaxis protein